VSAAAGRILLVGAGGLGSPAARILARSGVAHITVVDDDRVERSNLHRQVLFDDDDVGAPKAPAAARRLEAEARAAGFATVVRAVQSRFVPHTAMDLLQGHDVVVEGADNFATKFLVADASWLAGVHAVQAGAVRWSGWALAVSARSGACLRCVFEDVPADRTDTCAEAGVVGPVVGAMGALQAALALRTLTGDAHVGGELWSYRALEGSLRRRRLRPRPNCPLCEGRIRDLRAERYAAPSCAA
jgi:molybdopterin-synthase adenylyltransferase